MTDVNEVVRGVIIWSLEEECKKKDAEIERLRVDVIEAEKYNGYHQRACLEIERLRNVIYQYRSDLEFPPSADSIQRRLKMINDVLEEK